MDVLSVAREAGLAVRLVGRIGQQEFSSVSGSKDALLRFVKAIGKDTVQKLGSRARWQYCDLPHQCRWRLRGKRSASSPPANRKIRSRT
jgi:hypothetical protein